MRSSKVRAAVLAWVMALIGPVLPLYATEDQSDPQAAPLALVETISLPMVRGGMNHLAADAKRQQFFVTVPGANRVVVIDLKTGKVARSLSTPAAAARFLPDLDRLCVAGGEQVTLYDGGRLRRLGELNLHSRLDEIQYVPKEQRLYVGMMDPKKPGIGVVDVPNRKWIRRLALPVRPQGFVVEENGTRIYANTPAAGQVTVLDRRTGAIVAAWKLTGARSNYPIALDEKNHRLFVGCRRPPRLLVLNTASGKTVSRVETGGDADDMAFDPAGQRIYVACGDGVITAVQQIDADHYRRLVDTPTAEGARNSLFVADRNTFYIALPRAGQTPAQLRGYRAGGTARLRR